MSRRFTFTQITPLEQPLLFLSLAFICGMFADSRLAIGNQLWLSLSCLLWLTSAFMLTSRNPSRHRASTSTQSAMTAMLFAAFFTLGAAVRSIEAASIGNDRIRRQIESAVLKPDDPVLVTGEIIEAPEPAPDRIYLKVKAEKLALRGVERTATGIIQLMTAFHDGDDRRDYDLLQLEYGTRVRVLCHLSRPTGYRNPGSPNFHDVLNQRGIDAVSSVKSPLLIETVGHIERSRWRSLLYDIRSWAITLLLRNLSQPTSGLLVASLFGNDNFLDQRAAEGYRAGGTYHLLVISGLHVALIAGSLLLLTRSLIRRRWLRFVLVGVFVWGFAIMVGAQPPITRAAAMLSLALIGQALFRGQAGANTLGAAAVALLVWQPTDLLNPGFQLSFLTVLAIALGTGPLYQRLRMIGEWKPSEVTPHPPSVGGAVRVLAEGLFWNERSFQKEITESRIRYQLRKASVPRWLASSGLSAVVRLTVATLVTTIGIQVSLLPLMIVYFHRVSIISPLTNVIDGALVFVLMMGGCFYLGVSAFDERAAQLLKILIEGVGDFSVAASQLLSHLPHASFRVPDFGDYSSLVYGSYFAIVVVLAVLLSRWNPFLLKSDKTPGRWPVRIASICSSALIVLTLLMVIFPFDPTFERGRLSLTFLDVGQGDSIAITFPKGTLMLLDSGGKRSFDAAVEDRFVEDRAGVAELAVAPPLWRRGVKRLDLIGATHGDADHVQAFADLVNIFEIGGAISNPSPPGTRDLMWPFPSTLARRPIARQALSRSDSLEIDGVRVDVLAPFAEMISWRLSSNDRSLVIVLTYGSRRFLLTGDIESRTEQLLARSSDDLKVDVLKVAHHGSRTSSTAEFLSRTEASLAVISVGEPSPFGHPHDEVIGRLRLSNMRVLSTAKCGAITISTDGHDLRRETFVKCE